MQPRIDSEDLRVHRDATREFSRAYRSALNVLSITPQCGRGCSSCCTHDQPPVARFEAEILMELVRRRSDLSDVPEKLAAQVRRLDELAGSDPRPGITDHRGDFPCVFLGPAAECRVYDHRPLACVITYSQDRAECQRAVREGDFEDGRGWDPAVAQIAEVLRHTVGRLSNRTAAVVTMAFEGARSQKTENGRSSPPLLLMALAVLWSDATNAAITAAAEKAREAARARGARP